MYTITNLIFKNQLVLFIFFTCLITRFATTIFYIEDIDSLRFFLSAFDYNVIEGRPHFPGYPVYCFILKIIFSITGSIEYTFSIIGGFSMFLIIYFINKLCVLFSGKNNYILIFILLFNPLLWLMSNRFMPDILGLSCLILSIFYFLKFIKTKDFKILFYLAFSISFLFGIRLSYIPFLIPLIYLLYIDYKSFLKLSFFTFIISMIWFLPWVLISGFDDLVNLAFHDLNGHFNEWGGTVYSGNSSLIYRLNMTIKSIFSDGFGFWWHDRHYLTFINLIFLIPFFIIGIFYIFLNYKKNLIAFSLIFTCLFFYLIWIILYQNVVYKPRHILPLIPFFSLIISFGFNWIFKQKFKIIKYCFFIIIFFPYLICSLKINHQHRSNKSSLSQMHEYIQNRNENPIIVISENLKINYFKKNFYNYNLNSLNNITYFNSKYFLKKNNILSINKKNLIILSTIELPTQSYKLVKKNYFFHNPYVNRLWDHLILYEYKKK